MKRVILAACCLLPAAALPIRSAELAGVRMPDRVEWAGKTLVLNGLGLREATFLKVDVYVAGLYLEERTSDPDAILASPGPKVLVMHFVRKVKRKDIVEAWTEGFERNGGSSADALAGDVERLNGWMTDFGRGDELELAYDPQRGVEVSINDATQGTIAGEDFARVLWSIWLGPEPPNPGLKQGLLGE